MKMAEILRKLADIIDSESSSSLDSNLTMQKTKAVSVEKPEDVEGSVMVPPLQSKLELLKKSVGVENVYDEDSDELSVIKKNAGLSKAAQHEASEDNDITG